MLNNTKLLVISCMFGLIPATAFCQEIKLRAADSLPVGHYLTEGVLKPLMERAKELASGKVIFEHFPAQQLGKEEQMFSLVKSGVADIAYVGASYVADKLPLSSVGELPAAFTTSCEGTKAYWKLAKPGGALDQAEYEHEGVRVLAVQVLPPYQIFSTSDIVGLDSLKGQKIRATGSPKIIALQQLGAVPVSMVAAEVREALSRGTLDAVAYPIGSIKPYDLVPFLKSGTEGTNFGSFVAAWMISRSKFDSLPEDVQNALTQAGEEATMQGCEFTDRNTAAEKQSIKEEGVAFKELSSDDMSKLKVVLSSVGNQWANDLDARGKPGSKILAAFQEALKAQD